MNTKFFLSFLLLCILGSSLEPPNYLHISMKKEHVEMVKMELSQWEWPMQVEGKKVQCCPIFFERLSRMKRLCTYKILV